MARPVWTHFWALCALIAATLLYGTSAEAGSSLPALNIQIDSQGQQQLTNAGQQVAVAWSILSDGNSYIVNQVIDPAFSPMTVTFDASMAIYASYRAYAPMDTIRMEEVQPIVGGQLYAFNGTAFVQESLGVPGYVMVYYDAPASSTQPISIGFAAKQSDGSWNPASLTVLSQYVTSTMQMPAPKLLIFAAAPATPGLVVPAASLRPVTSSATNLAAVSSSTSLQTGRYLSVDLNASEQRTIHYDSNLHAFQYGAYPQ